MDHLLEIVGSVSRHMIVNTAIGSGDIEDLLSVSLASVY